MGDPALQRVGEAMAEGDSLAQAVRRQPGVFSPFYASMAEAAESAEKAEGILTALSGWLERADSVRRRVRTALLYPAIVLNVLLVEILYFTIHMVPQVLIPMARIAAASHGQTIPDWAPAMAAPLPVLALATLVVANALLLGDDLTARLP